MAWSRSALSREPRPPSTSLTSARATPRHAPARSRRCSCARGSPWPPGARAAARGRPRPRGGRRRAPARARGSGGRSAPGRSRPGAASSRGLATTAEMVASSSSIASTCARIGSSHTSSPSRARVPQASHGSTWSLRWRPSANVPSLRTRRPQTHSRRPLRRSTRSGRRGPPARVFDRRTSSTRAHSSSDTGGRPATARACGSRSGSGGAGGSSRCRAGS